MFDKLNTYEKCDPKGYYDLIKAMSDGSFDKNKKGETDSVDPQDWLSHFKKLLGPDLAKSNEADLLAKYVSEQQMESASELDQPITSANFLHS